MNHTLTSGGLLLLLGLVAGFIGCGIGLSMFFAGMMADANDDGTSKKGAIVLAVSAALFIGCIVKLFS